MTLAELAIIHRCAALMCDMCDRPDKWQPVHLEDDDYYHIKVGRFDDGTQWCDSNAIWHEWPQVITMSAMSHD